MTNKLYLDKEFDKFWHKIENGERVLNSRFKEIELPASLEDHIQSKVCLTTRPGP